METTSRYRVKVTTADLGDLVPRFFRWLRRNVADFRIISGACGSWLRRNSCRFMLGVIAALVLLTVCRCGDSWSESDSFMAVDQSYEPCDLSADTEDVEGRWKMDAGGDRSGCRDSAYNIPFRLRIQGPFQVRQEDAGPYDTLHLVDASGPVDFAGSVQGSCVEFDTEERIGDETLTFHFSGTVVSREKIQGEFTGSGPEECESKGYFEITYLGD